MLPFLDKKKIAGAILTKRGKADVQVAPEVEAPDSDMDAGLKECAEDILRAIEHKSVMDLAMALHAFFEMADAMPHVEGEHEGEDE